MKKIFVILYILLPIFVNGQLNNLTGHVNYNGHVGCRATAPNLIGGVLNFNADSQLVLNAWVPQGSEMNTSSVSNAEYKNIWMGFHSQVTLPQLSCSGLTIIGGEWTAPPPAIWDFNPVTIVDLSAANTVLNCYYSGSHTATGNESGMNFIGSNIGVNAAHVDVGDTVNSIVSLNADSIVNVAGIGSRSQIPYQTYNTTLNTYNSPTGVGNGNLYNCGATTLRINSNGFYSSTFPLRGALIVATGGVLRQIGDRGTIRTVYHGNVGDTGTFGAINFSTDSFAGSISTTFLPVIPATLGGTGQTSYAIGDILYASTTTALSKLADIARGSALLSNGVSGIPFYGKIRLDSAVAGILPVANGGTGTTSYSPFSPMTLTTIGNTVFGDSMEFAAGGNTNHWSTTETFSCGSSLIAVTPTYTDGLLGVANNGICFMGDMGIDFNGNFIKVNDASQEITFQSGGNLIFNGSAIFNGGVQLTSYTKNGGLLTTDSLGNVVQIDTASGSTRVLHGGNTWGRVDLTADVTGALPPATGGTGFSNSGTLSVTPNTTISGSGTATISMPAGAFTYTMPDTTSQIMGAIFKRVTGKTAASTVQVHGVGAADGSFLVSANILVTTATLHSFTATVTYTDEGNVSRTVTMQFSTLAGAFVTAMTNAQGAVPYEGVPLHIRCKASTNITISTTGTFTTVNYNLESCITKLN